MIIEVFDQAITRHADYAHNMPTQITASTSGLVACRTDLSIMGAILFDGFYTNSATASYQIDDPMCLRSPGLLSEAGTLAFETWKLRMLFCTIEDDNAPAIKLAHKMGWRKFAHAPHAAEDNVGLGFYQMREKDFMATRYYLPMQEAA